NLRYDYWHVHRYFFRRLHRVEMESLQVRADPSGISGQPEGYRQHNSLILESIFSMSKTRNLAILICDDVEVLDFCGPFEVRSAATRFTDPPAFNDLTVAEIATPVLTRGGLSVNPHHRLAD